MAKSTRVNSRSRAFRLWLGSALAAVLLALPLAAALHFEPVQAQSAAEQTNPRAEYWRAVRESAPGYTAASGPYTTNVLIQNGGENWRALRQGPVADIGAALLALAVIGMLAVYLFKGPDKLEQPPEGRRILRWQLTDRFLHWLVAGLFLILAVTGLSLLYGRAVMIPVLGKEGFAAWAALAKNLHNYLALIFVVALAVMIVRWLRLNIPTKVDWEWFKAGALFAKGHPHAGFFNAGEKAWFWILTIFGIMLCVSGVFLLFPNLGWDRSTMQLAHLFHVGGAIITIAGSIGHIYMGLLHVPGSLDGMVSGYVDTAWAKQHHDLWYEEVKDQAQPAPQGSSAAQTP